MSVIVWSEKLSVGIDSIDEQHKVLIALINSLNTAMANGEANMMIGDILLKLTDYTRFHFTYEEDLFERHGYENSVQHKKQHQKLIEQISALKEDYESDITGSIGLEIMQFLKTWLTKHIINTDMEYSALLIGKNVK
jgi:hemerythrin